MQFSGSIILSADEEEGDDARSGPFCINFIICVTFENYVNNMTPNEKNRLGGAQQFMSTHCFAMAQSGRVDPYGAGITSKQYICIQMTTGNRIPAFSFFYVSKSIMCQVSVDRVND